MVFVDSRVGSSKKLNRQARLDALLSSLRGMGLDAEATTLDYGDFAFTGRGPDNTSLNIAIELKTIEDCATSLRTGRLGGHQLVGLLPAYDFSWIVVEGNWRTDHAGHIVTYNARTREWVPLHTKMTAGELEKQILTLELCGGLHVRYTNTRKDTMRFIGTLYRWWTDKAMDQHTSHLTVHQPPTLIPVSDFRATVSRFPGIGLKSSKAVETHFNGSLRLAVNASVAEWADIATVDDKGKSRRLGDSTAARIVRFCEGER